MGVFPQFLNATQLTAVWGSVHVSGREFKDIRVWPGHEPEEWDWGKTGTHHSPVIQIADLNGMLTTGAKKVVLSTGFHGRLGVPAETVQYLEGQGLSVIVQRTEEAVKQYNQQVAAGNPVA